MSKQAISRWVVLLYGLLIVMGTTAPCLAEDASLSGAVSGSVALTAEEEAYVQRRQGEPLVVAASTDMAPMEYYDEESGAFGGFNVDVYQLISRKTGLQFSFAPRMDAQETRRQLENGEVQIIGSLANNQAVADALNVALSKPFYTNTVSLISKNTWSGTGDADSVVAVKAGYPVFVEIAKSLGYEKIIEFDSFSACIDAVNSGKADLTLISSTGENILLGHAYYASLTSILLAQTASEYSIGVAKTEDADILLSILNKALDDIPAAYITQLRLSNLLNIKAKRTFRDFLYESGVYVLVAALVVISVILFSSFRSGWARRRANAALQSSNAQLQRVVQEKERAIDEARSANEAKSEFLSRMSHDMRTPLNAVLGFAHLAENEEGVPCQVKEYLAKINSSGQYLLGLINDVLDMAKIESGKIALSEQTVDGPRFLSGIEDDFRRQAEEKNIRLVTDFSKSQTPWVVMDPLRSRQIYSNLLSNAIKYSNPGTEIYWGITDTPTGKDTMHMVAVIRDQGFGMSAEFMTHMFDAFEQENATAIGSGVGLRLSIVKALVTLMGGTIRVESEVGKGSTFTVEMDRRLGEAIAQPGASAADALDILRGKRVLLVEDHPLNAQIAAKLLEKQGMLIDTAENGQLAVDRFAASATATYDAVLMDIRMPVMDGLTAAKAIRALPRADAAVVPIIAMTANAFEEDAEKSRQAGMNAHIAKPIEPQKLYEELAKQIQEAGRIDR